MKYFLLHTNGENCQLFCLKKEGTFQIWTNENLEKYGFSPEHSPYYIVLHFDNKPMEFLQTPQCLKQRMNILIKQDFIPLMSLCKKFRCGFLSFTTTI
jgi:hypothetical protein